MKLARPSAGFLAACLLLSGCAGSEAPSANLSSDASPSRETSVEEGRFFTPAPGLAFSEPPPGTAGILDRFIDPANQVAPTASMTVRQFSAGTAQGLTALVRFAKPLTPKEADDATQGLLAGLGASGAAVTNMSKESGQTIYSVLLVKQGMTLAFWLGTDFESFSASADAPSSLAVSRLLVTRTAGQ